jgi:hypothetical protein
MTPSIIRTDSSIGNAETAAPQIARRGAIFPTSGHTTRGSIGLPGSNTEPVSELAPLDGGLEQVDGGFLTADGQHDSHAVILADGTRNGSPRAGQPYRRIRWDEIRELVEHPAARTKDRARLVIPSTYAECDGRTHEIQRQRGRFGVLCVDIDSGSPSLDQVVDAVRSAVGDVEAEIYSSSSATPEARKWRILFPLATTIAGADYADTQTALFGLLQAEGLVCDHALARAAQPVFLPNVPPHKRDEHGRPLFYQWQHVDGHRLDLVLDSRIVEARNTLREKRQADEDEQNRKAAEHREKRLAYVAATGDKFDPVDDFKARHSVAELLQRYGFKRKARGKGSHWASPLSTSGSYSTEDRGDHWVTVSAWARNHNVGRTSRSGNSYGDAFDLYVHFEHSGDRRGAVLAYIQVARPDVFARLEANRKRRDEYLAWASGDRVRPSGGPVPMSPAVRVEHREQPLELVPIDQYRRDLQQAVAEVVLDGSPGVKLLRGAPGSGKTFAVARTVARYPQGITSVPGHELAAEVVEKLREAGADAAAYPRLDEQTCGHFEVASRARAAGLSVPATVCPKCPLLRQCRETGYLAGVREAERAPHKVVTHARLSRSAARLTKDANYVVLEEDPTSALVPTATAKRRDFERIAELADALAEAERRWWILEGAETVANAIPDELEEFAAWAPEVVFRDELSTNAGDGKGTETPTPPAIFLAGEKNTRRYPRGFFGGLCRVADQLADELYRAAAEESPVAVRELHVEPVADVPKNPEGTVWRAVEMIERADPDGAVGISPDAMRLVLAIATGRIHRVFVQVENDARPGGKRTAEIVGLWRTWLPAERMPVFVNDGTIDADIVRTIVGDAAVWMDNGVIDITPPGAAPLLQVARQYPLDILPTTSTAKVSAILTGIIRANPERERVGVVLHQRHYRELVEADDSPLPTDVRSRIVWSTYFGSGADRGTNTLHQVCDLAVVVGTHRPPPAEIRRTLLRWGELEAAAGSSTWGMIERCGVGADGADVAYHGRGYASATWARAADACTRATMRQAVGRARAICPDGVPVIAVTTEATGLPVEDVADLPTAEPRVDQVADAVRRAIVDSVKIGKLEPDSDGENRAKNPNYIHRENGAILAGGSVGVEEVEKRLPGIPRRTVLRWMSDAVDAGVVVRIGAARATRYTLAPVAEEQVARHVVGTKRSPRGKPAPTPEPRTLPLVAVRVEPTRSPTVEIVKRVETGRTVQPAPVLKQPRRPMSFARVTPPPVVEGRPPAPDWLGEVVSPDRHPDELLGLRFFMAGPYAESVGLDRVWASDVTPGLVLKLHNAASTEAKRRGQQPPPVDVVAGHTCAWFAVAAAG